MPFSRNQHTVMRSCFFKCHIDCPAPVFDKGNIGTMGNPFSHIIKDGLLRLRSRIICSCPYFIGTCTCHTGHLKSLSPITVPATTKNQMQPSLGALAQHRQSIPEGIWCMGIIYHHLKRLQLKYAFEAVVVKASVVLLSLFIHDCPQSRDIFTFSSSALRALLRA